jgi:site-specific recombinase XerD
LSPGTVTIRLAALRFFYIKTLKKAWSIAETPYPKKTRRLPAILSQEEVTRLIRVLDLLAELPADMFQRKDPHPQRRKGL